MWRQSERFVVRPVFKINQFGLIGFEVRHTKLQVACQYSSIWLILSATEITIRQMVLLTLALRDSRDSSMCNNSELSISSNIPVIFPARSGYMLWMSGNRRSPSICFCSCGGAAANMDAVRGSCPWTSTACGAGWKKKPFVNMSSQLNKRSFLLKTNAHLSFEVHLPTNVSLNYTTSVVLLHNYYTITALHYCTFHHYKYPIWNYCGAYLLHLSSLRYSTGVPHSCRVLVSRAWTLAWRTWHSWLWTHLRGTHTCCKM